MVPAPRLEWRRWRRLPYPWRMAGARAPDRLAGLVEVSRLLDVFVREGVYAEYAGKFLDPAQVAEVDVARLT